MMWFGKRKKQIEFDEILLDASNLPSFDTRRIEGRREVPIATTTIYGVGIVFCIIMCVFAWRITQLQVVAGEDYYTQSVNNKLSEVLIIAERGVIYDRNEEMIAWNELDEDGTHDFPVRAYTDRTGLGQLIGFVSYPKKDSRGFYFRTEYLGRSGLESSYNDVLQGKNGIQLVEINALGEVISDSIVSNPVAGNPLHLSVDANLSQAMHDIIATSSAQAGFRSGAAAIMNVNTGEVLAMTSFPSFDPEVMADGDDVALIASYDADERFPFMNKNVGGVYTPGSIVKPFVAYAALEEKIIDPEKIIVSTGEIVIPNPYTPSQPSRFTDWRAHGAMNMKEAIAFSSNVYFYYISGGFADQKGLGITKMDTYFDLFRFGTSTGVILANEQIGTVPSPDWKQLVFDDDWRLGDTYNTSIGQFGWQTTPLQMLRAYGAIANGGKFFTPHFIKGAMGQYESEDLNKTSLDIIREGMHMTTYYPGGTARALEKKYVSIAAKSGTAEIGAGNAYVNSWAAGYWPYDAEPEYAFIMMMDKAPRSNALGATRVMGDVFDWMEINRPEYLGIASTTESE